MWQLIAPSYCREALSAIVLFWADQSALRFYWSCLSSVWSLAGAWEPRPSTFAQGWPLERLPFGFSYSWLASLRCLSSFRGPWVRCSNAEWSIVSFLCSFPRPGIFSYVDHSLARILWLQFWDDSPYLFGRIRSWVAPVLLDDEF